MALVVLVIDDERDERALLRACLEREGWEVEEAEDGQEGLMKLEGLAPDVIILDLQMPRLDGLGFLRERQELGLAPDADVIVHSGSSFEEVPGYCVCLAKPFQRAAFTLLLGDLRARHLPA